jgi:stage II sporulation protein D
VGSLSKPWLVGVPDPYDTQSPYHRWTATFSARSLDSALGAPGAYRSLKVLKRGVSPRVVRARVIGSAGSRVLTGPQIRAALGLRDTWFTFVRVSSSRRGAGVARLSASGTVLTRPALVGSFSPAPRKHWLTVERQTGKRWKRAARTRTSKSGRYYMSPSRAGSYRVRAGRVAGPAVRLR